MILMSFVIFFRKDLNESILKKLGLNWNKRLKLKQKVKLEFTWNFPTKLETKRVIKFLL